MLSMIFRYPILMSIGNGNINYIQLPIKDDDDVRFMFHVVAQIPPSNTIEMYLRDTSKGSFIELSPSFDQEIMGHDNLAHNDEMGNLASNSIDHGSEKQLC
ncbi:hypothetical protein AAG906_009890 [Vitis piasezkii]